MLRFSSCLLLAALSGACLAAEGRIYKVLPSLLDTEQRQSLAPSLFERDAYQAYLRKHPAKIGGRRFDVHWSVHGPGGDALTLRLELRTANRAPAEPLVFDTPIDATRHRRGWVQVRMDATAFKEAGEVTSWRARLMAGEKVIAEQASFLW